MDREAIEKIEELSSAKQFEINGYQFTDKPLFLVPYPVVKEPLTVFSLYSIIDYLRSNLDSPYFNSDNIIINVTDYNCVNVVSCLTGMMVRHPVIRATVMNNGLALNQFMKAEAFNIMLQTCFYRTEARTELMKLVSNMSDEHIQEHKDDGVSQSVSVKSGIKRLEMKEMPNPIVLIPLRTFPEVQQPNSTFILRVKRATEGIDIALYDFNMLGWKSECVILIKELLCKELPTFTVI